MQITHGGRARPMEPLTASPHQRLWCNFDGRLAGSAIPCRRHAAVGEASAVGVSAAPAVLPAVAPLEGAEAIVDAHYHAALGARQAQLAHQVAVVAAVRE